MATPSDPTPAVPQDSIQIATLAAALAQAINATKPPPKITIANRVPQNPMNPSNRKRKLDQKYYQNFSPLDVDDLTDIEFDLLPKLRDGLFIPDGREGFLVEVVHVKRGAHRGMHIRYNNSSIDKRMEFDSKIGGSLEGLLTRCIAEAAAQKIARKQARLNGED